MKFSGIPFYFFPTTLLLVDDNERFLETVSFKLDDKLAYQTYDKPYQALQFLKEEYYIDNIIQKQLKFNKKDDMESEIFAHLYKPNRFNEVSTVLVDYSMPSMNGIEFCRQIKNMPFKKILVTGEAENDLAVKAFNEGVIDKFIRKDNFRFAEEINRMIAQMQWEYFQEKFVSKEREITENIDFYNDSAFIDYFNELRAELQIVEYYLIDKTNYILFDLNAEFAILNVSYSQNESNNILSKNLSHQPQSFRMIKGKRNYYCSIIESPTIANLDATRIVSYHNYLGL